jgi:hypothetical protein
VLTPVLSCPKLLYHASATRVTSVETQTASTTASHNGQCTSSRGKPHCYHYPFPVQEATDHVAYLLQPAIFLPE